MPVAQESGTLSFVLRPTGEALPSTTKPIDTRQLSSRSNSNSSVKKSYRPARVTPKKSSPSVANITVIRGDSSQSVSVKKEADRSFQVLGKSGGKTNVMLYDQDNQLVDIVDVTVGFDVASLKKTLFETFPNEAVEVRPLAGGIYLSGDVSSESVADRAVSIAEAYAPSRVTSGLAVRDSHQVMLEVRFVDSKWRCPQRSWRYYTAGVW